MMMMMMMMSLVCGGRDERKTHLTTNILISLSLQPHIPVLELHTQTEIQMVMLRGRTELWRSVSARTRVTDRRTECRRISQRTQDRDRDRDRPDRPDRQRQTETDRDSTRRCIGSASMFWALLNASGDSAANYFQ